MAGINHRLGWQREQHAFDALSQVTVTTPGQIVTTDAALVKRIASEYSIGIVFVKADVSRRMAWDVKHLQRKVAYIDHLTVVQLNVRVWGRLDHNAPQVSATAGPKQGQFPRMDRQLGTCRGNNVGVGRYRVPMRMRVEYVLDRQPESFDFGEDLLRVPSRVNYSAFECLRTTDDIAVRIDRSKRQCLDNQWMTPLPRPAITKTIVT